LKNQLAKVAVLALSMCIVVPCSANLVVATGDPSTLATAQDLTLAQPTEIAGTLDGNNQNDVNIFKIDIYATPFSAFTLDVGAFGIPDTALFLFDSTGVGVYMNDDISGSDTFSCLPSGDASNPCPTGRGGTGPLTDGIYYLAISRSANYPVDALSDEIFSPVSSTDVAGPSNTNPVAGWDGGTFTSPNFDQIDYDIILTGAVPEPMTWPLTAGAVLMAAFLRRKRIAS
jgi:hypothetical protein